MTEDEREAVIVNLKAKLPKLLLTATDRKPHEACGLAGGTCGTCKAQFAQEERDEAEYENMMRGE
jgi:hypothetical protein